MRIIKTTEQKTCKALVRTESEKNEETKNFAGKFMDFFTENKKRALVIACSLLLIGSAIFLNWQMFGDDSYIGADGSPDDGLVTEMPGEGSITGGEADVETFFALAVIERQRARDEAIEVLEGVVESNASAEEKNNAIEMMSKIALDIKNEGNIETLLKSRGFEDCIAIIDGEKASVIIGTERKLMANEIAQITEAVMSSAGISPTNLVIKEKMMSGASAV